MKTKTLEPPTTETTVETRVERICEEAEGVISLELCSADGSELPAWEPGSHIDVMIAPDLIRQYSLCSSPEDPSRWRIGVLKEPKSRGGSEWIHDKLSVGDTITCRGPRNNFRFEAKDTVLFIAGGIGITPLIPMIAQCESAGVDWRLVYGGRNRNSMAFRDELGAYSDRVTYWPEDELGLIPLADYLDDPADGLSVYCCGPGPLLDAVEGRASAWSHDSGANLHIERFRPKAENLAGPRTSFTVFFDWSEIEATVPPDKSILDVALEAGVDVPSSCREGTCGTCETVLLEGEPDHRDSFLTDEEKASGEVIMPCCSRAKSESLILDL